MRSLKGKEYNDIKTLANMGVSKMELMRMFKRSRSAIGLVINTKDYSDYMEYRKQYLKKPKTIQTALPIKDTEKTEKSKLDYKQGIILKFNELCDLILVYKMTVAKPQGKQLKYWEKAVECLEEARLWLKETF